MRRGVMLPLLIVVVAATALLAAPRGRAQEGTPTPGAKGLPLGVAVAPLLDTTLAELPAAPARLQVARLALKPGTGIPATTYPGVSALVVEAGSVKAQCGTTAQACTVVRAAAAAGAGTPAPATGLVLKAGDGLVIPGGVAYSAENDGPDPASLLVVAILPATAATPPA